MLSAKKSIYVSGQSKVSHNGSEVVAVQLSANISENDNSNINSVIVNQEAYDANKETCRTDIDEFTLMVREIEDNETI